MHDAAAAAAGAVMSSVPGALTSSGATAAELAAAEGIILAPDRAPRRCKSAAGSVNDAGRVQGAAATKTAAKGGTSAAAVSPTTEGADMLQSDLTSAVMDAQAQSY